ncbi:MAG: DUF4398 domain-containing protein [Pseudomonadota bacterium]|nr:DUF4398 domain-containing protein [Pseudomonadota bacterium]
MNASFAQISRGWHGRMAQAALLLALAGCATLPPPTAELAAARTALANAGNADADQYSPDVLASARAELSIAQAAMAEGRNAQARDAALMATAGAELASADSRARVLDNEYAQRRDEIARLRAQLQLDAALDDAAQVPALLEEAAAMTPSMRLQALDTDPRYTGMAAYERLQARQALDALAEAGSKQRATAAALAARRVRIAELAARSALVSRELARLDQLRSELLVEASRRDAERARREAERLRIQAQIQAEEAQRLRATAEAETAARLKAEEVILDVGGAQARKLRAARNRAADLARQEAELMAAQQAAEAAANAPEPESEPTPDED